MTSAFPVSANTSAASAPRQFAAALAGRCGFNDTRAGQVALIVSEMATNIAKHTSGGQILVQAVTGNCAGLEVLALDKGPGLPRAQAFTDGYSTAGTLGAGLGAIQRQADEFGFYTQPKVGTVAVARVWIHADFGPPTVFQTGALNVPKTGEHVCGDDWSAQPVPDGYAVIVADGLGHGPQAAEAASAAIAVFRKRFALSPVMLIDEIHSALRSTRGAAVAVARCDWERRVLRFVGVGNIAAALVTPSLRRQNLASNNGTAGVAMRRVQEFTYPIEPGSTLILHSDGIATHWNPQSYPGLWEREPALPAGVLYRDFTRGRDDSTVVAVRMPAQ